MPPLQLNDIEARIVGALVEKSLATPDQYPLSLNSLTNACNQKTSRDPVTSYDEAEVARGIATLQEKGLVTRRSEPGSRVTKFQHHIEVLLNGGTAKEIGIVCVLLLRGPQTPGEIKSRTDRLCEFSGTAEVEGTLQELSTRSDGPFVIRLPRQPGQKEARYQHLFSGAPAVPLQRNAAMSEKLELPTAAGAPSSEERLAALERRIAALEAKVQELLKINL